MEHCDTTWTAVETRSPIASGCTWRSVVCRRLRRLPRPGRIDVDAAASYYYRRDTGTLVYAQFFSPPNGVGSCAVVGTAPFFARPAAPQGRLPGCRVGVRRTQAPPGSAGSRAAATRSRTATSTANARQPGRRRRRGAVAVRQPDHPDQPRARVVRRRPRVPLLVRATSPFTLPFTLYYDEAGADRGDQRNRRALRVRPGRRADAAGVRRAAGVGVPRTAAPALDGSDHWIGEMRRTRSGPPRARHRTSPLEISARNAHQAEPDVR